MYKYLFEGKKLVIFDMDGTLVKTEELWKNALNKIMENTDTWHTLNEKVSGLSTLGKWDYILHERGEDKKKNAAELAKLTESEFMRLANELPELEITEGFWSLGVELKENKGFKLALATNSSRQILDFVYNKVGFGDAFDFTIAGNEVGKPKPNPEIYNTTLRHFGVSRHEAIIFEDSLAGSKAAVDSGVDTIVLQVHEYRENQYPSRVKGFVMSLEPFVGNIDHSFMDRFKHYKNEYGVPDTPQPPEA